jgi:hypothetical protein
MYKFWGHFCNFLKTAQSKPKPNRRKSIKSGHPVGKTRRYKYRSTLLLLNISCPFNKTACNCKLYGYNVFRSVQNWRLNDRGIG